MQEGFLDELSRRWSGLTVAGRFALVSSVFAALGVLALVVLWSKRVDYRPLYGNIKAEEAAGITKKLKEMKISYTISDDGSTILVPSDMVYQVRMDLAGSGLTDGSDGGFELFDKTRFQTSPLSERVTYVRALQGELQKTIETIGAVDTARVHLVLPQREILVDDASDTSASIVLTIRPGQNLGPEQVKAIKALVAGSVQNLKKENITVMDAKGKLLASNDDTDEVGGASTLLDLQRTQERQIERKTQEMLDQVLGAGMSVVKISVALENRQSTVESEDFKPADQAKNTGVIRSTQTVDETYTGGGRPVLPNTQAGQRAAQLNSGGPTSSSNYKNGRQTVNYEISKTLAKQVENPGGIRRMTVAVGLSAALKLNRPALDDITAMVTQATGADPNRKDEVKVAVVPFMKAEPDTAAAATEPTDAVEQWMKWGRISAPILAALLFWVLGGRMGRSTRLATAGGGRGTRQLGPGGGAAGGDGSTARMGTGRLAAAGAAGAASQASVDSLGGGGQPGLAGVDLGGVAPEHLGLHARMLAMDDPQATAQLLEKWITEGGE